MRFYITRHGQPDTSDNAKYQPQDHPLSELGREQARLLGRRLKNLGFNGRILCSPFYRTSQTAEVIAGVLNSCFYPEPILRERNTDKLLDFEGMTLGQLREKFAHLADDSSLTFPWFPVNRSGPRETDDQGTQRVTPLVNQLKNGEEDVLLVGHNITAKSAARAMLNISQERINELMNHSPYWNCGLTVIDASINTKVLEICSISHLPEPMVTSNWIPFIDYQNGLSQQQIKEKYV